ncbi:hypothetical protein C8Q72DRAFT_552997 [Fomitopsis betulina]|nr:hypothetical protein C8Q72DRAFT_552997 [Fomitopsis betulina]
MRHMKGGACCAHLSSLSQARAGPVRSTPTVLTALKTNGARQFGKVALSRSHESLCAAKPVDLRSNRLDRERPLTKYLTRGTAAAYSAIVGTRCPVLLLRRQGVIRKHATANRVFCQAGHAELQAGCLNSLSAAIRCPVEVEGRFQNVFHGCQCMQPSWDVRPTSDGSCFAIRFYAIALFDDPM